MYFPEELWLLIAANLDGVEATRLSMVSKFLHALVPRSRALWLNIVRARPLRENVPEWLFATEEMDVNALMRLATRTDRHIINAPPEASQLAPGSLVAVTFCDHVQDSSADRVNPSLQSKARDIRLLRGGRWVIGVLQNDSINEKSILCWDTLAHDEHSICYAVAQLPVLDTFPPRDDGYLRIAALDYSAEPSCVRILLLNDDIMSDAAVISLALNPGSGSLRPVFTLIGHKLLAFPFCANGTAMNGDWVMHNSPDYITLWNWKRNNIYRHSQDAVKHQYFLFPDGSIVAHHEKIQPPPKRDMLLVMLTTFTPGVLDESASVTEPIAMIVSPTVTLEVCAPYDIKQRDPASYQGDLTHVEGKYILPLLLGNIAHIFVARSPQGEFHVSDVLWRHSRSSLPRLAPDLTKALWRNYSNIEIQKSADSDQLEAWLFGVGTYAPLFVRCRRLCTVSWMPPTAPLPRFQVRGRCTISGTHGFVES